MVCRLDRGFPVRHRPSGVRLDLTRRQAPSPHEPRPAPGSQPIRRPPSPAARLVSNGIHGSGIRTCRRQHRFPPPRPPYHAGSEWRRAMHGRVRFGEGSPRLRTTANRKRISAFDQPPQSRRYRLGLGPDTARDPMSQAGRHAALRDCPISPVASRAGRPASSNPAAAFRQPGCPLRSRSTSCWRDTDLRRPPARYEDPRPTV